MADLHSSKLKEFADDNFEFDENSRSFFRKLENTVEKGDIARYKQFLLFHSVCKRLVLQTHKNQGLFGKGLTFYDTISNFNDPKEEGFGKHCGKGENAG